MSRKIRTHYYGLSAVIAKRSKRVREAVEKLRAFRQSLSRIPVWLSEGRLDEQSALFMMAEPHFRRRGSYEQLTKDDVHSFEQHLEVAATCLPGDASIPLLAGIYRRLTEPRITMTHVP